MKRRIVSIICIMFLFFAITSPISGSIFSYADEPQQEQLSQDEVIKAAIALYLNERKAWITSTTSAPIDAVQNQMQIWIDSYDFWTNHTTIGSAAAFYAQCIVRYNPFRISLKGPAVRALNDLYNWLIDTGKLPNLEEDNSGGETTDSLYNGYTYNGNLCFYAELTSVNSPLTGYLLKESAVQTGNKLDLFSPENVLDNFLSYNNKTFSDFNGTSPNNQWSFQRISVHYYSGNDYSFSVGRQYVANKRYAPSLLNGSIGYSAYDRTGDNVTDPTYYCNCIYSSREVQIRGFPAFIILANTTTGINKMYYGWAAHDSTDGYIGLTTYGEMSPNDHPYTPASVNLDTDNFDKTDPTPPEGDNEVTYTPEDKTTGDTYNTYNEYITNYVTKNTVVNNNNSGGGGSDPDDPQDPDQPSGGTTPPWDNSSGAGTLTPDGNGGYNFNLPDLTLPDLNIDWNLRGLSEKFPFSIPWDLMAFFTVLNAEPETPAIEAQIDLGIVDWDIDWDLHNFDTLAALLRNLEFIGFCLALILITRSIIKG